jgi:hypothetical protein
MILYVDGAFLNDIMDMASNDTTRPHDRRSIREVYARLAIDEKNVINIFYGLTRRMNKSSL